MKMGAKEKPVEIEPVETIVEFKNDWFTQEVEFKEIEESDGASSDNAQSIDSHYSPF